MKTFEEIQVIVQERLKKARVIVQNYKERKERENQKPVTPVPPTPAPAPENKPTKPNGKAK
jgi:hypothetical protein